MCKSGCGEPLEVVNLLKDKDKVPREALRVFECFFDSSNYINLALQADRLGELKVKDFFSSGYAVCDKSYFMEINFLEFVSKNTGEVFFVLQHRSSFYSLYIPSEGVVYCLRDAHSHHQKIIDSFRRYLEKNPASPGGFNGFIVSDARPYHYFYDCLTAYLFYVNKAPELVEKPVFSKLGSAFLKTDLLRLYPRPGKHYVSGSGFNNEGFFLYAGRHGDAAYNNQSSRIFNKVFRGLFRNDFSLADRSPVIWFGLSEEKRKWAERDSYLESFCRKIAERYKSPLLIFDGLTLPEGVSKEKFVASLPNNKPLIENLASFFDDAEVVNMAGCTALEKLECAKDVDFYFSNALTDSIWCSKFHGKVGVAISSKESNVKAHAHPLTFLIDNNFIADITDGGRHFSEIDFSCDPNVVCDQSEASLVVNYEFLHGVFIKTDRCASGKDVERIAYNRDVGGFFQISPSLEKTGNDSSWFVFSCFSRGGNGSSSSLVPVFEACILDIKFDIEFISGRVEAVGVRFYSEEGVEMLSLREKFAPHKIFEVPQGAKNFELLFSCEHSVAGFLRGIRVQPIT